ncbi:MULTISPECIES: hypothetical protein [unclassified Asaia]|uniref:hypothetical protein n=1 Tax=unclassified Asaia TaxID=2685023 RepID=UPI001F23D140|nr:hypothetical protein [Asaia sp. W19]
MTTEPQATLPAETDLVASAELDLAASAESEPAAVSVDAAPSPVEAAPAPTPDQGTHGYPVEALYFDANWYLAAYPDVGACGMDPVEHFMTHGYLEGRDPNGHFSVGEYIAANPDIPLTINPFLHFIMHGAAEGRPLRR